jgi:tetratricopeptide (TPR) repeat protein
MPKKVKYGIILCVLVVLGFGGYAAYKKGNEKESFVKEVNRNLSAADRKTFEDRVADDKSKLASAQTDDDRFGWDMQLGYNLEALGSLSDAQIAFENAIKLKPDDFVGYTGLFQVQVDRADYQGALKSISTAIEKAPTNPDIWKRYALLEKEHLNASNDTISSLYSEAVVKTNSNIDIITTYADWLQDNGNLQASKEYWQKAIEINPKLKKIYQAQIDKIDKLLKQQPK